MLAYDDNLLTYGNDLLTYDDDKLLYYDYIYVLVYEDDVLEFIDHGGASYVAYDDADMILLLFPVLLSSIGGTSCGTFCVISSQLF